MLFAGVNAAAAPWPNLPQGADRKNIEQLWPIPGRIGSAILRALFLAFQSTLHEMLSELRPRRADLVLYVPLRLIADARAPQPISAGGSPSSDRSPDAATVRSHRTSGRSQGRSVSPADTSGLYPSGAESSSEGMRDRRSSSGC